jgi:hypothetical protein
MHLHAPRQRGVRVNKEPSTSAPLLSQPYRSKPPHTRLERALHIHAQVHDVCVDHWLPGPLTEMDLRADSVSGKRLLSRKETESFWDWCMPKTCTRRANKVSF